MEYLIIGKIINTHGINGEVKVDPLTDDIERFKLLEDVYIGDRKEKLTISSSRKHKESVLLLFNEYDNINDVLKYKNQYIYINFEDRVDLPENHYFIYELIGLEVRNPDGKYLGDLVDVMQLSSNDVYLINGPEDNEFMVPAVKEFVKKIDLEKNILIIDPIEGMI